MERFVINILNKMQISWNEVKKNEFIILRLYYGIVLSLLLFFVLAITYYLFVESFWWPLTQNTVLDWFWVLNPTLFPNKRPKVAKKKLFLMFQKKFQFVINPILYSRIMVLIFQKHWSNRTYIIVQKSFFLATLGLLFGNRVGLSNYDIPVCASYTDTC
jgi:hypothetical protein